MGEAPVDGSLCLIMATRCYPYKHKEYKSSIVYNLNQYLNAHHHTSVTLSCSSSSSTSSSNSCCYGDGDFFPPHSYYLKRCYFSATTLHSKCVACMSNYTASLLCSSQRRDSSSGPAFEYYFDTVYSALHYYIQCSRFL